MFQTPLDLVASRSRYEHDRGSDYRIAFGAAPLLGLAMWTGLLWIAGVF